MKIKVNTLKNNYNVIIDRNLSNNIYKYLSKLNENRKIILIYPLSLKESAQNLSNILNSKLDDFHVLEVIDGEDAKNIDNVQEIVSKLVKLECKRDSLLLALGGGTIGDIIGYVSSIYMRGINYINIPSTLLSMVDSSLGGKTAINYGNIKNLIGSFHQPTAVFINPIYLKTLNSLQIKSGMGEIIKYSLIRSKSLFMTILENYNCIVHLKDFSLLEKIIYKCCLIKKHYIEQDEYDKAERNVLNFGHTLGHIIEKKYHSKGITHGEAVLNGIFLVIKLSFYKKVLRKKNYSIIKNYLEDLNINYNYKLTKDDLQNIYFDKKVMNNKVKFILLKDIGEPFICDTVLKEDLLEII